jgi:ATP-binding cassette subfamily B protein
MSTPQLVTKNLLLEYVKTCIAPFWRSICIMFAIDILWAIGLSLQPYLLKMMINALSIGPIESSLARVQGSACCYLGFFALLVASYRFHNYIVQIKMIPLLRHRIGSWAFEKLLGKDYAFYQNELSGRLSTKVNDLIQSTPEILQLIVDRLLTNLIALIIAVAALWKVQPHLGLLMGSWAVIFFSIALQLVRHFTLLAHDWSEKGSSYSGRIVDALSNILAVRIFNATKFETRNASHALFETTQAEQKLERSYCYLWIGYGFSFWMVLVITLYLLIQAYQAGNISVGDFALVLTINLTMGDNLRQTTLEITQCSKAFGTLTQALETIYSQSPSDESKKQLRVSQGKIAFENIYFQYTQNKPLFQGTTVHIPGGQKIGLVGYSGSGKSTFVSLVLRLKDIQQGQILIDGQDINQVSIASLRETISLIPQDGSLFHQTIFENIQYAKAHATKEEVQAAAQKAQAHDFIQRLDQGYDTMVGERGVQLSGGQRARISIARAFLRNAPILILDEATAQLDSLTETLIQESLAKLMENKTTIIIAHRLSTLLQTDRILVFDKGKIVQDDSHHNLITQPGLYSQLWKTQQHGFIKESEDSESPAMDPLLTPRSPILEPISSLF